MGLVEKRKGSEHGMIRKDTAAKNHAGGAHEAMSTNRDGLTVLAVVMQVDGVAEDLRAIAGQGGEGPDGDAVRAVDVVVLGNGGLRTEEELGTPIGLVGKVWGFRACGKSRDPIPSADGRPLLQHEEVQVHSHGEVINAGAGRHGEVAGVDPCQPDARRWIEPIAMETPQEVTLQGPGEWHDGGLEGQP